jgi:predicted nucleotidyltransferase
MMSVSRSSSTSETDGDARRDTARASLAHRISQALEGHPEVLDAYLFGSQASGRVQSHSDVDVAVYLDPSLPSTSPYGVAAQLGSTLMSALGRNDVDVVVLNRASPLLYHRVLRDGLRVLARDLRAATTREGYALSRYCDFVPQLAKAEAARTAAEES